MSKWNPKFIAAGHNFDSRNMQFHKKTEGVTESTHKIQSFGPAPNSTYFTTSCNSFDETTENMKAEDNTTETGIQLLTNRFVELKTKLDQLKENLESTIEHFEKLTEMITEVKECGHNHE